MFVVLLLLASLIAPQEARSTQATGGGAVSSSTSKRPITEKDLFDFVWVADPQLSPDGARVAFTRVVVDEKRLGYETSIRTVANSGNDPPLRIKNGKHK
jgi:hypothetical protein